MGGGNPISVAANFRLVFDTRSAARTATRYDAALAQRVGPIVPCLAPCGNVRNTILLIFFLHHRKDAVSKLLTCLVKGHNGVEV